MEIDSPQSVRSPSPPPDPPPTKRRFLQTKLTEYFPPARASTRPNRPLAPVKRLKYVYEPSSLDEKDLFHRSNFFITNYFKQTQISCMLTVETNILPLSTVLPAAFSAVQKALVDKLEEKHPNRRTRQVCVRVDHPQLTATREMFVHLRPSTDLGAQIMKQIHRCSISDRPVDFRESFKVSLIAQFV